MSLIRIAEIPNAGPRGALASSANIGMPSFSGMRVEPRTAQATGAAMLSDASSRRAAQGMVAQTLQLDAFSAEARAGMALGQSIGQIGQVAQQIGEKFARAKDTADIARGETILRSAFEKQVNEQLGLPVEEWQANWQRNLNTAKKALSEVKFSNNAMEQFGPSWERWSSLSGLQIENMARKKQIEGYRMDVEANAMMKVANEDYAGAFSVIDRGVADGIFSEPEGNLMKARMEDNIYRKAQEDNANRLAAEMNSDPDRMAPLFERRAKGEDVPELGDISPAQAMTFLDRTRGILRARLGDLDDAADQAVLTGEIKDEKTLREKFPGLSERRILSHLNDMQNLWEASPERLAEARAARPKLLTAIENYDPARDNPETLEQYFTIKDQIKTAMPPGERQELLELLSSARKEGSKMAYPVKDALSTVSSLADSYFAPGLDEKDLESKSESKRNRALELKLEGAARHQEVRELILQWAKENPQKARDPEQVNEFLRRTLAPEAVDAASKLFEQKTTERAASMKTSAGFSVPITPAGPVPAAGMPQASTRQPASIRNNNAGAMWPASWQKRFGGEFGQNLNDGKGNKIAKFPTPVHGAAATMYLLGSNRLMYSKKTLKDAIATWSNASGNNLAAYVNAFTKAGFGANEKMADIMADQDRAITFAKVMSRFEAGQDYPLNNEQWAAAYRMYREA